MLILATANAAYDRVDVQDPIIATGGQYPTLLSGAPWPRPLGPMESDGGRRERSVLLDEYTGRAWPLESEGEPYESIDEWLACNRDFIVDTARRKAAEDAERKAAEAAAEERRRKTDSAVVKRMMLKCGASNVALTDEESALLEAYDAEMAKYSADTPAVEETPAPPSPMASTGKLDKAKIADSVRRFKAKPNAPKGTK